VELPFTIVFESPSRSELRASSAPAGGFDYWLAMLGPEDQS
jgi:hypothetical protein